MDKRKRLYIIAGHYGSGKTNIAVNLALKLKSEGLNTKIVDLDIVNPYFRTKDSAKVLEEAGIELISPAFANTNVDLPALPKEVYGVVQARDCYGVIDVGGDDRGAYALGRYAPEILEENNFEMCFVANFYRPLTKTAQEALEVMREIEEACKIKFTAIINNSNLGCETTEETVISTLEKAKELCELSGLPLLFNAVEKGIKNVPDSFNLELQEKYYDIKESK
ncbi:MAG: hypothetical protein IKB86_06095 [Clostridia bacterium]|nr:hypothetical protein [Clostridia bacterium]MBR6633502.1 hypothetical protein [Clostridia bacterium]